MSDGLLDENYVKTIADCNNYLERYFRAMLSDDSDVDISEKIAENPRSKDIKQFYYYSLYCWRMFYYLFEKNTNELNRNVKYEIKRMEGEGVFINKGLAESDLPRFTFYIAKLLVIYRALGGVISYVVMDGRIRYVDNFNKIQDFAPYISDVLKRNKIKGDFYSISYVDVWAIKDLLSDLKIKESFDALRKINENEVNLSEMIGQQETLKKEVDDIEERLDGYKGEYNFVLLSKAFNRMKNDKRDELKSSRKWMNIYTLFLVFIPIITLVAMFKEWVVFDSIAKHITYSVPLLTLEILIFYFMRLYYSEVRSIRAQLLQIDLRLSLCEFIHDFIEKKNESRDHSDSWGNFESLIFSPIQMSADNIPSVLDGANAVADVLGKVMPKK